MATLYKCPNIGNCEKADKAENISIDKGLPIKCPECGKDLMLWKTTPANKNNAVILLGIVLVLLLLIGGGAYFFLTKMSASSDETPPALVESAVPAPAPVAKATTLLRFAGSNTIGGKLLPALATAYLQQQGCQNVQKQAGANDEESHIVGDCQGQNTQINIQAHGSSTAFKSLKDGLADIGMSSRKIKAEEQQDVLATLGDLSSNASEQVLALDGIAVIVHGSNPLKTLSIKQVADIFSGAIIDWSHVGGKAGAISVCARDDKSGTYDFFKEAVLKAHNKSLIDTA